jgi:hypothetical protein
MGVAEALVAYRSAAHRREAQEASRSRPDCPWPGSIRAWRRRRAPSPPSWAPRRSCP